MKNMKFIALFLILMIPWGTMAGKRQINMADLGVTPQTPDCTPAIVKCLQECKDDKNITMLFEKGTYHFFRMYLYIKDVTNEILFDFMWYYFFVMDVKFIAY